MLAFFSMSNENMERMIGTPNKPIGKFVVDLDGNW